MAITVNSTTIGKAAVEGGKKPWLVSVYSADANAQAEQVRAAPSSGIQVLESIQIECEALAPGETISIFNGSDLQLGPIPTLGETSFVFQYGLAFSGAIKIQTSAARPIHVVAEGFDTNYSA